MAMALSDVSAERRPPPPPAAADPGLSEADRKILDRVTTGEVVDEFQATLDAHSSPSL